MTRWNPTPVEERFWAFVPKTDGCWEWTGFRNKLGYAQFSDRLSGKKGPAARWSWQLTNGPIPNGLWVLHHCDNPPCVRPDHLFLGTPKDNTQDMLAKGRCRAGGRHIWGETHHKAKLTETDVMELRRLRREGWNVKQLGAHFGINPKTAWRIAVGRAWTHVS